MLPKLLEAPWPEGSKINYIITLTIENCIGDFLEIGCSPAYKTKSVQYNWDITLTSG